ncbi:hypothetical protein GCM10023189_35170 [Nibrella saemangeumensis]|uniref:Uncharacterized protein n=1 Tax=Nibrella saemangeumensis TaxID=1084526 RepID=A0ABP8N2P6_9BACT
MRKLYTIGIVLFGLISACRNPIEGVELRFITPSPVAAEVLFTTSSGEMPAHVNIRIVGPDAGLITTTVNSKRFRLTADGVLYLSVDKTAQPSPSRPLRFWVVAKAEGYTTLIQPVQLTDNNTRSLSLRLTTNAENKLMAEKTAASTASGVVQETITVQSPTQPNQAIGQSAITISQGTRLDDLAGEPVGGPLQVQARQLDISTKSTALAELPGNGVLDHPIMLTGQRGSSQAIHTIGGAVNLELFSSNTYQVVKTFSKPVRLNFAITPGLVNPITNRPIEAGDQIPLFSYDAMTNTWRQEVPGQVQRTQQGQLEYVAEITHLSIWLAAFTRELCDAGPSFKLVTAFSSGAVTYTCQVIQEGGSNPVVQSFNTAIYNGKVINLWGLERNTRVKFRIFDAESRAVVTSGTYDACSQTESILDVRSFKPVTVPPVTSSPKAVTITLQFPCKKINAAKLPTQELYARFRETGTTSWKMLPVIRYESGKTTFSTTSTDLTPGKTYDLQAGPAPGYYSFNQPGIKLGTYQYLIKIKTKEFCE